MLFNFFQSHFIHKYIFFGRNNKKEVKIENHSNIIIVKTTCIHEQTNCLSVVHDNIILYYSLFQRIEKIRHQSIWNQVQNLNSKNIFLFSLIKLFRKVKTKTMNFKDKHVIVIPNEKV